MLYFPYTHEYAANQQEPRRHRIKIGIAKGKKRRKKFWLKRNTLHILHCSGHSRHSNDDIIFSLHIFQVFHFHQATLFLCIIFHFFSALPLMVWALAGCCCYFVCGNAQKWLAENWPMQFSAVKVVLRPTHGFANSESTWYTHNREMD